MHADVHDDVDVVGLKKERARRTRRSTRRALPFGGSSIACRCANRVAPSCAPSREGPVLLGVLLSERLTGLSGSPFPAATSAFSAVSCGVSSSAVHLRLAPKASSSRELSASSRVLRPANCLPRLEIVLRPKLDRQAPPLGSTPSSRHRPAASTTPRRSQLQGQVPSAPFLTTSRVCSASSLCGFISPRCHVQGLPSRGFSLSTEPYRVSPAVSCPLAGWTHRPAV